MTDTAKLRAVIRENGMPITFLAACIGVSRESFYHKLNNETEFKASEIVRLTAILHLSQNQRDEIFFALDSE